VDAVVEEVGQHSVDEALADRARRGEAEKAVAAQAGERGAAVAVLFVLFIDMALTGLDQLASLDTSRRPWLENGRRRAYLEAYHLREETVCLRLAAPWSWHWG